MSPNIQLESVVVATRNQVSTEIKGETVLLQLKSGKYYSLDQVGTAIWEHLKTPIAVSGLVDFVVDDFEVDRERCETDVLQLIGALVEVGFVEINS